MVRRSKRAGVTEAKAKAKKDIDTLESWSRTGRKKKVLALALPPKKEDYETLRKKATGRAQLGLLKPQRQTAIIKSVGSMSRHILFLNLGDETILAAARGESPPWERNVRGIVKKNGKIYLEEGGHKAVCIESRKTRSCEIVVFQSKKTQHHSAYY